MDFIKKGRLIRKYLADGSEFKKKGDSDYILKSTTNPKFNRFIGQSFPQYVWDLISKSDYTEGPEYNRAYTILIEKIRNGEKSFATPSNIPLIKDEKIIFTANNIDFSEFNETSFIDDKSNIMKSLSASTDEIEHIDTGNVSITNKRFAFSGPNKITNIDLNNIKHISCYYNGIRLKNDKEKIKQFIGFETLSFNFRLDNKKYFITFNGDIIKALIEAGLNYYDNENRH